SPADARRAVRSDRRRRGGRQPGRGAGAGQRHQVRADRRAVLARAGRDRRLPRPDRGRRHLCQPRGRRDHRGLAGRAAVRRREGQRPDRQDHRRPLHAALLPAREEPDVVHMTAPAKSLADGGAEPICIVTEPPGPRARDMIARALPHLSPSLIHCYPLMVRRASGCMVEDVDGNVYLDAEAGVATASTGHCHPAVADAMAAQAQILIHICGTDFHYPGYGAICEKLGQLAQHIGPNAHHWQTFLTNSGTEAVEAALKLARNHTGRQNVIAFRGGFHGRTLGALSLTASKSKYRRRFGPLLPGVFHATYGDAGSVEELFKTVTSPDDVAAIVVEPILG